MRLSIINSSGQEDATVDLVDSDAERDPESQRVRIRAGDVTIFVERGDLAEFVGSLAPFIVNRPAPIGGSVESIMAREG